MRSAFRAGSNLLTILSILIAACAGTYRADRDLSDNKIDEKILDARFIRSVGPTYGDDVRLASPSDIAVNRLGEVFISDGEQNIIVKLSGRLDFVSYEGGIGSGLGDFNRPSGMACDAALNLYIADPGNRRIQVMDRNLHQASAITEYFDTDGSTRNFNNPEDVAIDFEGNLWVADDDRVLKINPFNELNLELSYSSPIGLNIGKAISIAATGTGIIAIGDSGNKKVFIVSSYGNIVSEFQVGPVNSVAWEGTKIIWVSSGMNDKISSYDIYGNLLFAFADDRPGARPASLSFDRDGTLLVADESSGRISQYRIIRNSPSPSE